MTAVTIQSNKIVSHEVKDNEVLLEPSSRKNQPTLANPMCMNGQKCRFHQFKEHDRTVVSPKANI